MSIFPTKILLATDGSEDSRLAAETAVDLSKKLDSELHVVYVEPMPEKHTTSGLMRFRVDLPAEVVERVEQDAKTKLQEQVQKIEQAGGKVVQPYPRVGLPEAQIVALAEELGVGLIVMGSRGLGGIRRTLMGSVSDSVVRHAHCPVMVVRGEAAEFPTKILLATDGSEEARLAAATAAEVARRTSSELHVVHVGEVRAIYHPERHGYLARYEELREEAQRLLEGQVERVKAAGAEGAWAHLEMGPPEEEIVVLGQEIGAGLIVMGSRGLGRIRRALMGSVSDSVVRHAHCPVMVVRPEEERSVEREADFLT